MERTVITQGMCDHVRILLNGGATLSQAAQIVGVGHATISRIKRAKFDAEEYKNIQKARQAKEEKKEEEPLPGQLVMDLKQGTAPMKNAEDMDDRTKMMRFMAAQNDRKIIQQAQWMDELCMKIDKLNDTLSMLVRAMRKE